MNKRKPMTLLLDSKTITILQRYAEDTLGSANVSQMVRSIAREIQKREGYTEQELEAYAKNRKIRRLDNK